MAWPFLAVYAVSSLNGKWAIWAGAIDCVVGLSAPFAATYLVPIVTGRQRGWLIAWMVPGILDFVVAIPLSVIIRLQDPRLLARSRCR